MTDVRPTPKPFDFATWYPGMRQRTPDWDFQQEDTPVWAPLQKPLAQCTIAMVCTAGVHLRSQDPFDTGPRGDVTFREIPGDVNPADLMITHAAYDHSDADRDINCVFPIERLRELAAEGVIGGLASSHFAMMGRVPSAGAVRKIVLPTITEAVQRVAPDAVFLTCG